MPNRTKPMPKQSAQKRQERRQTDPVRHANIKLGVLCEACQFEQATDRHEIPAGCKRHKAVYEPHAQMDLCRSCHEWIQSQPPEEQLLIKLTAAVQAYNRCAGSKRVTIPGVLARWRRRP